MSYTLINLIKNSGDSPDIQKKILRAVIMFSKSAEEREMSADILNESIELDVTLLESLVNPDKFNFEDVEIGRVAI